MAFRDRVQLGLQPPLFKSMVKERETERGRPLPPSSKPNWLLYCQPGGNVSEASFPSNLQACQCLATGAGQWGEARWGLSERLSPRHTWTGLWEALSSRGSRERRVYFLSLPPLFSSLLNCRKLELIDGRNRWGWAGGNSNFSWLEWLDWIRGLFLFQARSRPGYIFVSGTELIKSMIEMYCNGKKWIISFVLPV